MIQQNKINFFQQLDKGQLTLQAISKKAVIIFGLSSSNNFLVFNLITESIQRNENLIPLNLNKQNMKANTNISQMTPNWAQYNNDDTCLIQFPGLGQPMYKYQYMTRMFYFKFMYQKIEQIKFIISFDQSDFYLQSGNNIIKILQQFIGLFKSQSNIIQLARSIVFAVVFESKVPDIQKLMKQVQAILIGNKFSRKIIHLLSQINKTQNLLTFGKNQLKNIYQFPKTIRTNPNWIFLNMSEVAIKKGSLFELNTPKFKQQPWTKRYTKQQPQIQQLNDHVMRQIGHKINSISNIIPYFDMIVTNMSNYFPQIIDNNISDQIKYQLINSKRFFIFIQKQVLDQDINEQQIPLNSEYSNNLQNFSIVKAMLSCIKIIQIANQTINLDDSHLQYYDKMQCFRTMFQRNIPQFHSFCRTVKQQIILCKLQKQINKRIKHFCQLYDLHKQLLHSAYRDIRDRCCWNYNNQKVKQLFFETPITDPNCSIFHTLDDLRIYQKQYQQYCNHKQLQNGDSTLDRIRSKIKKHEQYIVFKCIQGRIYNKNEQYMQGCRSYIQALSKIDIIAELYLYLQFIREIDYKQLQPNINSLYFRKLELVAELIHNLSFQMEHIYIVYKLSTFLHKFDDISRIFDKMLENNKYSKHSNIVIHYYQQLCRQWGEEHKLLKLEIAKSSNFNALQAAISKLDNKVSSVGIEVNMALKNKLGVFMKMNELQTMKKQFEYECPLNELLKILSNKLKQQ